MIDTYLNALGKAPDKELDVPDFEDQLECVRSSNKLGPQPACKQEGKSYNVGITIFSTVLEQF